MTKPPEPVVTGELKLIDAIISAYHTTRLSEVSAAEHILSKPYVRKLLDIYRTANALPGDVGDHADIADKIIAAVKADDDCRGRGKFEVMQILAALTPSALSGDAGEGERLEHARAALQRVRDRFTNIGNSSPLWCDMAEDMDAYAAEGLDRSKARG